MRQMFSRALFLTLVLLCALGSGLTAAAAEPETPPIQPFYIGFGGMEFQLVISNSGQVSCYGQVNIKGGYTGDLTMELQAWEDGDWTEVESWYASGSGTLSLDKFCYVSARTDYQIKLTVNTYGIGGRIMDSETFYSDIQTY